MSEDLRSYADKQTEQRVLEEIGGGSGENACNIVQINFNEETGLIDKSFNQLLTLLKNGKIPVFYYEQLDTVSKIYMLEQIIYITYDENMEYQSKKYTANSSMFVFGSDDPDAPMVLINE